MGRPPRLAAPPGPPALNTPICWGGLEKQPTNTHLWCINNALRALALSAAQLASLSNTAMAGGTQGCINLSHPKIQDSINSDLTVSKARALCTPGIKQGIQALAGLTSLPGTVGMIDLTCTKQAQLDALLLAPNAIANTDRFDALVELLHGYLTRIQMVCPSDVPLLVNDLKTVGVTLTPTEAQMFRDYAQQYFDLAKTGHTLSVNDFAPLIVEEQSIQPQPQSWEADTTLSFGPRD